MKFQKYERERKEENNMLSRCFCYKANNLYVFPNKKATAQAELLRKKNGERGKNPEQLMVLLSFFHKKLSKNFSHKNCLL